MAAQQGKKLDVRIAMSQSKLEELYEDPNIPPEFGTLILMINTELEKILTLRFMILDYYYQEQPQF